MSMLNEAILLNYKHKTTHLNTALNVIGATTDQSLRTVTAYNNSNCKHVRKFGTAYNITTVTGISDPTDVNMTFKVYSIGGTLLGSRTGGAAFVAGSIVASQGCYLKIEASGGTVTVPATVTINTNVDAGGKIFVCAAESITTGNSLILYLSATTSTYYDSAYKYGGARHTPTGTSALPYFSIPTAISVLGGAFTIVTVLDSEFYDFEDIGLWSGTYTLQAALGQTPTITSGTGARVTREVSVQYNNLTAIYFNDSGNDSNAGTWQAPKKTPAGAFTAGYAGVKICVYGGANCSGDDEYILTSAISFTGATTGAGTLGFESDYGYILTLKANTAINLITLAVPSGNNPLILRGINFIGTYTYTIRISTTSFNYSRTIEDCNINMIYADAIGSGNVNINRNIFNGKSYQLYGFQAPALANTTGTITISRNIFTDCLNGIYIKNGNAAISIPINVSDNLFYNNLHQNIEYSDYGTQAVTYTGTISNNTFYGGDYALYLSWSAVGTTFPNPLATRNIFRGMAVQAVYSAKAVTISQNDFYDNVSNVNVNVTNTSPQIVDPLFCNIENYYFGLSGLSTLIYPDAGADDFGYRRRILSIGNSTVNGFIFDGQLSIINGTYHVGTTGANVLRWNSFKNFVGMAVNGTAINYSIYNCKMYHNGDGVRLNSTGNTIQENLIYNNKNFGIFFDDTNSFLLHNTIAGNKYGVYISAQNLYVRDCIISSNSVYGVYSETNRILLSYTNIDDARNEVYVFIDDFCFTDSASLVDLTVDSEDLNIKTVELGYTKESPAKDSASDGYDMGAIKLSRSISGNYWRAHELTFNPRNIEFASNSIGLIRFEGVLAELDTYAKDNKLYFSFRWNDRQYSDTIDRKKIQYLNGLLKRRAVETLDSETIVRITFLKTQNLVNGTGTVSAALKTITDATKNFTEEEWRGFFIGVKYATGSGTGTISASAKTLAVSGSPGWTTNQWAGYFFRYGKYWYYVLSNTADTLILSDPEDTLTDAAGISWSIEKYFKCSDCFEDTITVLDPDAELPTGSYSYYIGFIECRVARPGTSFHQPRYYYQQENWKTGYSIDFQER